MSTFEKKAQEAIEKPQNMGEMSDADGVGTVGSADCGDMMRMWVKYTEKDGKKVIDRASFQAFGCQTALAVASMATELLKGMPVSKAQEMGVNDLTGDLGALPPMKIHCGEMVQEALKQALESGEGVSTVKASEEDQGTPARPDTLAGTLHAQRRGSVRIVPLKEGEE